jgi:parallel beta-helix repeat protein
MLTVSTAQAQLIVEDFDSQTTGSPPAWRWWNNGSNGTILVNETTYRGSSGRSVEISRTAFENKVFGFGRNFSPIDGLAELTYYFRVESTDEEILTAIGGNNARREIAWWVGVGGTVGNAIGTHSHSGGWNHVMDVTADTWYGVTLQVDPASFTYDITVWEDGNPANAVTETGIPFRDGSAVEIIDQIQFGNLIDEGATSTASAFIDDVAFIASRVLKDDFESGNTGMWSSSTRPRTAVTTCYQTVVTDAYLANDLNCDTGAFESVGVELGTSNIVLDLNGHTISGHPIGLGVQAMNLEGVTIKNGIITDFVVGVDLHQTDLATVQNVKIGNLVQDDPDEFVAGMRITQSQDIMVRNSFVEFLPVVHKEALVLASSDVKVDNIEVKYGSVGVNISGDPGIGNIGSRASVLNSRFVDLNTIGGILVQWARTSRIAGNEFTRCGSGVVTDNHGPGGITDITIEGNIMYDNYLGVQFMGSSDSYVLNNVIRGGHMGVLMDSIMGCPPDDHQEGCYYATNNLISGNHVTGAFRDLWHHPYATGNTWLNNTCQYWEGAEIEPCIAP